MKQTKHKLTKATLHTRNCVGSELITQLLIDNRQIAKNKRVCRQNPKSLKQLQLQRVPVLVQQVQIHRRAQHTDKLGQSSPEMHHSATRIVPDDRPYDLHAVHCITAVVVLILVEKTLLFGGELEAFLHAHYHG